MASGDNEGLRVVDKFNGENFSLWKFKMEMVLASCDLRDIIDESEGAPPSDVDVKNLRSGPRLHLASLQSTWWTRRWHTSSITRDQQRLGRPFATSMRPKTCSTSCS